MPRQLSPERQRELDELFAVDSVLASFFDRDIRLPSGRSLSAALLQAYERRDLAGVRMVHADFVGGMLPACSAAQRRELDRLLRAGPGVTLDSLEAQQLERIRRVQAKGRISSVQQYYMLKERVEVIWDDPARVEEFRALQALLDAYEERAARRARPSDQAV
jgi:hypothetical protein